MSLRPKAPSLPFLFLVGVHSRTPCMCWKPEGGGGATLEAWDPETLSGNSGSGITIASHSNLGDAWRPTDPIRRNPFVSCKRKSPGRQEQATGRERDPLHLQQREEEVGPWRGGMGVAEEKEVYAEPRSMVRTLKGSPQQRGGEEMPRQSSIYIQEGQPRP